MKNISLILNVVLLIAVGVLYVFTFNSHADKAKENKAENNQTIDFKESKVVFVSFDTLVQQYQLFQDLQEEMIQSQTQSEAQLTNKTRQFEKAAADFQNKVQKGLITRKQAQELQQQLVQQEQELYQYRDQLTMSLAEQEQVMLRQIQNSIEEYLVKFNKETDYNYVLSKTFGGQVLYSRQDLDITQKVLEGLNKDYEESKK